MFESEGPVNGVTGNGAGGGARVRARVVTDPRAALIEQKAKLEASSDLISVRLILNDEAWSNERALRHGRARRHVGAPESSDWVRHPGDDLGAETLNFGPDVLLPDLRKALVAITTVAMREPPNLGDLGGRSFLDALFDHARTALRLGMTLEQAGLAPREEYTELLGEVGIVLALTRAVLSGEMDEEIPD